MILNHSLKHNFITRPDSQLPASHKRQTFSCETLPSTSNFLHLYAHLSHLQQSGMDFLRFCLVLILYLFICIRITFQNIKKFQIQEFALITHVLQHLFTFFSGRFMFKHTGHKITLVIGQCSLFVRHEVPKDFGVSNFH